MCDCYVQHLSEEARFGLHYGAHNPTCPAYRVSHDPVDRAHDEAFRARVEIERPAVQQWTAESVREQLPDVLIEHPGGGTALAQTAGRDNPRFGLVGHLAGGMVEVSWAAIARCLNTERPIRY